MRHRHQSLFFPLLLITVGCIALLINLGLLPPVNLNSIVYIWPLWLIFLGLDIMLGYRSRWLNALIWTAAMVVTLGMLMFGPTLGLLPQAEVKREVLQEPLGTTRSATIKIELPGNPVTVMALEREDLLFEASISYLGDYEYDTYPTGTNEKVIELGGSGLWALFYVPSAHPDEDRWRIGLTPLIPLKLDMECGSGSTDLDLRRLLLRTLDVEASSGAVHLTLPESGPLLKGTLYLSSGPFQLTLPEGANAELRIEGGSGPIRIERENGVALRLIMESTGSGALVLPTDLQKAGDNPDIWETPTYASASRRVTLIIVQDSGALEVAPVK